MEMPILMVSQRRSCGPLSGGATNSGMALISSMTVRVRLFRHTHPNTTNGESAASKPRPLGRVRLAKVKRLLSAPPVKTQP
jgi:hypothetical protein